MIKVHILTLKYLESNVKIMKLYLYCTNLLLSFKETFYKYFASIRVTENIGLLNVTF